MTTRILMVCMGNICRSPSAEVVLQHKILERGLSQTLIVHSAGTHAYHVGSGADVRSTAAAKKRGYDLSQHCAQAITANHFETYDWLLAMDAQNLKFLQDTCPNVNDLSKIRLLLSFAPELPEQEVPDPYYGGPQGFDHVLDLIEQACDGFLDHLDKN